MHKTPFEASTSPLCSWAVRSGQSPSTTWSSSRRFCLPCRGTLPGLGHLNVLRACWAWWLRYSFPFLYMLSLLEQVLFNGIVPWVWLVALAGFLLCEIDCDHVSVRLKLHCLWRVLCFRSWRMCRFITPWTIWAARYTAILHPCSSLGTHTHPHPPPTHTHSLHQLMVCMHFLKTYNSCFLNYKISCRL